jgi:hypothetical protein
LKAVSLNASPSNGSLFGGDDPGFLKEGVMTYLMAPMSPLYWTTFSLYTLSSLHIYSLWIYLPPVALTYPSRFQHPWYMDQPHMKTCVCYFCLLVSRLHFFYDSFVPSFWELFACTSTVQRSSAVLTWRATYWLRKINLIVMHPFCNQ